MRRSAPWLALLPVGAILAIPAASPAQTANGGVAIGGDVSGSTINVGISATKAEALVRASGAKWKNLTDTQRAELRDLERELGVTSGALKTFLATLGEKDVPAEMLPARLGQIAGAYLALKGQLQGGAGESPQRAALKEAARAALDQGRLDEADAILRRIEEMQDASLDEQMRQRAQTAAQRATLAMSRLRYKDAAAQFAVAERLAPDDAGRRKYGREHARTLLYQAEEFNDAGAQREAIQLLRARLAMVDPVADAEGWGGARRDLGYALVYRGVANASADEIDESLRLLREARGAPIATSDLVYRIETNRIYGQVLCDVGTLRHDAAITRDGARALADAVKDLNAKGAAGQAAFVSIQLSSCVDGDGTPAYDTKTALVARQSLIDARARIDREKEPFAWAETTISIAALTIIVGQKEKSLQAFGDARGLLLSALSMVSPEKSPDIWQSATLALATSLAQAGKLRISVAPLEEAKEVLDAALPLVRSRPFADRRDLEIMRFVVDVELGLALNDVVAIRGGLDDLGKTGFTLPALDADSREAYLDAADRANAFLKRGPASAATADPTGRGTKLALTQIGLDVSTLGASERQAKAASFADALKTVHRCRDATALAKSLGAAVVERDAILASDLPEPVRATLARQKVGSATPPFGSAGKLRALVLCGRKTDDAPAPTAVSRR